MSSSTAYLRFSRDLEAQSMPGTSRFALQGRQGDINPEKGEAATTSTHVRSAPVLAKALSEPKLGAPALTAVFRCVDGAFRRTGPQRVRARATPEGPTSAPAAHCLSGEDQCDWSSLYSGNQLH
jgi:hypothetical protein